MSEGVRAGADDTGPPEAGHVDPPGPHAEGETLPGGEAPELLADEHERRKRDLLRAALFGGPEEARRIGRFRLLRRLGAGGMGVVYAAHDEQLGRDVAVKLLRSRAGSGSTERDRLLREAQAMAKLSHPGVVTVYEVGFHGDQLFVAMEMVHGQTLSAWLREKKRSVREVLGVFTQAGRGLAAAHAAGLVHRDFKPDNVMLDEARAVKVLDFGLARQAKEPPGSAAPPATEGPPPQASALDRKLTVTGSIMGTPAYMAPEQFAGDPTDARTDQYAFCVSLYEALHGERPLEGDSIGELAAAIATGKIREAPPGTDVPSWLRRAIVRGLAKNPEDRWPSMEALLAELARDPAATRRRRVRAAIGIVLAGAAIAATAVLSRNAAGPPVCEGGQAEIEAVWGPDARAAVRGGLGKARESYAADAAERAVKVIDRHALAWAAMHREACLANVRGEQSSELLDLRMACLSRRRAEVRALAAALSEGAPGTADRAVTAAEGLSPLAACADAEALRAQVKPPDDPGVLAAVERTRAALLEVEADDDTGQYTRGLTRARAAVVEAERTGYRPLIAEAAYDEGAAHISLSQYDEAVRSMDRAYFEALATGHDTIAAHAARQLFTVLGYHQSKREASAPWEKSAGALVTRLHDDDVLRAGFLNTRALVRTEAGELDAAAVDYTAALTAYEGALGPQHLQVSMVLSNMAQVAYLRGRYNESAAQLERALSIREAALGPDHPDVVSTLTNLSLVRLAQGKTAVAIEVLERALAAQERVLGKDHPKATYMLNNLGDALLAAGRPADALARYRHALAILEGDRSSSRLRVAMTRSNVGYALIKGGKPGEAVPLLADALAIRREMLPAGHAAAAETLLHLGLAREMQGELDEALPMMREALATLERAKGSDHPSVAGALTALGRALLAKRDVDGARANLERALAIRAPREGQAADRGETRFWLAKALVAGGRPGDRDRAAELAAGALSDYRAAGDGFRASVAEIEAWAGAAGVRLAGR